MRKIDLLKGAVVLIAGYLANRYNLLTEYTIGFLGLTVPPSLPARDGTDYQHTQKYFRKRLQFSDLTAITAGVKIGRLPSRALILGVDMWSSATPFNAATTNTVQLGSTQAGVDVMAATALPAASTLSTTVTVVGAGLALANNAEVDVWIKFAQTGTAATAGDATVVIRYVVDNDG